MPHTDEPIISVNGVYLSTGQAMTLRVALGAFLDSLTPETVKALGGIGPLYIERAVEVMKLMIGDKR